MFYYTPISGEFECPDNSLKCPGSYCIDIQYRCDGNQDCPNGEDEWQCEDYTCPGHYRCRGQSFCIAQENVCDGVKQCPRGDDELFCGNLYRSNTYMIQKQIIIIRFTLITLCYHNKYRFPAIQEKYYDHH